jgi:dipeptidyl-peptidase 4
MIPTGKKHVITIFLFLFLTLSALAQGQIKWSKDGNSYYRVEGGEIVQYALPANTKSVLVSKEMLTPSGTSRALPVRAYSFSADGNKVLIYNNSKKVWRLDTRGEYWVLDMPTQSLKKLGGTLPASSLMFAKFSPDATKVVYVSGYNLYVEDLATSTVSPLTEGGHRKNIFGTFDWVYEEEFYCRDGFQWSPDGTKISFWHVDATKIKDYYMLNTTDSTYSKIVPVEYPVVGEAPSPVRIGVIDLASKKTEWLKIPGDPAQNYLPRMEWKTPSEIFIQQLNRKQNETRIYNCSATGDCKMIYTETEKAWIDAEAPWEISPYSLDFRHTFKWQKGGKEFLWFSEKDGWKHVYRVNADGTKESLVTTTNFDVMSVKRIVEESNMIYFLASPGNATQQYLYKLKMDGKSKAEKISPAELEGTHDYNISPNGKFAFHTFNNTSTPSVNELISLPDHKVLIPAESISSKLSKIQKPKTVEFFKIKTEEGVEMDGWMVKPTNFDPSKKYPVLFSVYAEPGSQTVTDGYGAGRNSLYDGNMADDGYLQIAVEGRGTPAPKGREWRKCIYRQIGRLNIKDQAMAAKEILKWPFVDPERIAVWGWSGGGSTTLNLLFQYPEIYKTGIAVAAVAYQPTYDNIYQERYMGIPQENMEDFVNGSPVTYAKNLKGNLLYIHGTGDDNVHFNNAEMLVNELVKYNKQFQFMAYPNRTHGISEGEGTSKHLSTLYTQYLRKNCPPGGR